MGPSIELKKEDTLSKRALDLGLATFLSWARMLCGMRLKLVLLLQTLGDCSFNIYMYAYTIQNHYSLISLPS